MSPIAKTVLIVCAVLMGLPILACGGCLMLGIAVNASITPEQREQMRLEAERVEKSNKADQLRREAEAKQVAEMEAKRPKPSMANYQRVQNGMTYKDVISIIGEPSQELSRSAIGENEAVVYMWKADSFGGNMNATFSNGRLVSKAQFNLP